MTTGRFARAEELARAGRYGDAAIAVEQVAAEDVSLLADAAWMCERAGEAARAAGDRDAAIALYELARRGKQIEASWATGAGEGMAGMAEVERLGGVLAALRRG